jgi:hypothetical protein
VLLDALGKDADENHDGLDERIDALCVDSCRPMANSIRAWNNGLKANSSSPVSKHRKAGFGRDPELPKLARLGATVMSAILSLWEGKREEAVRNKLNL